MHRKAIEDDESASSEEKENVQVVTTRAMILQSVNNNDNDCYISNNEELEVEEDTTLSPMSAVCLRCELAASIGLLAPALTCFYEKAFVASPLASQNMLEVTWHAFLSILCTAQHDAHKLWMRIEFIPFRCHLKIDRLYRV
ncbi:hypothetical protein CCR75_001333 [Bremia lactucae]|uniref:Uncharacterized protein n=1 Tax=Bremia lactucae TaxID=4779 RepID=A0A976IBF2_BRELC|nr:hypothetical protein CCR75_001333 [Bremia lactucae]